MSTHGRSPIGSVFERKTSRSPSASSSRFTETPETGFPTAQHRSKSAFARAREANSKGNTESPRHTHTHPVVSTPVKTYLPVSPAPIIDPKSVPIDTDALLRQIHEENTRTIVRMSGDEIEQEKHAILEQLGAGTELLLGRVQEARRRKEAKKEAQTQVGPEAMRETQGKVGEASNDDNSYQTTGRDNDRHGHIASPTRRVSDGLATRSGILRVRSLENMGRSVPSPSPATSSTRPTSRTGRRLRFAEVTPEDVHVYESAPKSPKRAAFALPPPPDVRDDSIVSLGTFHKGATPSWHLHTADNPPRVQPIYVPKDQDEPEEGTPEYIRRRYFPNVPAHDASLAWMEMSPPEMTDPSVPRFDLHGVPIPASLSSSLPSHLGLHHHAEGTHAGYTIDDIFLLSRSTVPAQRASMFGVLAKIAHRLGLQTRHADMPDETVVFAGQEGELRKRILASGLTAIDQIGGVGARAVEVVWECLVEWDRTTNELEGVELAVAPDLVSSLQLDYLLPRITEVLSHAALPSESLAQLLAVLPWLARQSNQVADMITATPRLILTILDTFLLTPTPPREGSLPPNPLVLQILITLASASRSNALALLGPADALLRFVLPLSSPYPPALSTALLTYTLRFYTILASYGLYSHIVTTASQIFTDLALYIFSSTPSSYGGSDGANSASRQLRIEWVSLIHAWTVCATDPHATKPPHEILWSQVCAWGWVADVRKLKQGLSSEAPDWPLYAAIWDCESAWLEGARINGIKGGEGEREEALQTLRDTFATNGGIEFGVVHGALGEVQRDLQEDIPTTIRDGERLLNSLASAGSVLASALRLWLACLPPLSDGTPLSAPPFTLPFSQLSAFSATLVKHPIWSLPSTLGAGYLRVYLRPLTRFVTHFHRVSRYVPGTTPQLWFAQSLVFLSCLHPGDESYALTMVDTFSLVTSQFIEVGRVGELEGVHMGVLRPFFEYAVRPEQEVYVAPLQPTTGSIARSSTLRLPSSISPSTHNPGLGDNDDASGNPVRTLAVGLPLTRDFLFTPLTHLLRSGTSPVFHALPDNWAASEVDVVRATLLLAYAAHKVLIVHGLEAFVQSAAEVVFACMRVCMLEHGVGVGIGKTGVEVEVFRDAGVEWLMARLLEPFTVHGHTGDPHVTTTCMRTLEEASMPYLGAIPFYQFYTDLVALYGAVSFGHRIFAVLVMAPLAMHYAVDYRRALWCGGNGAGSASGSSSSAAHAGGGGAGLGDIVRSVRIPIEDVVCTGAKGWDPREYLYPVERDVGLLGAYVAALVARDGAGVEGFLRLVAVHHIACTVWRDLDVEVGQDRTRVAETETEAEAGRKRLEEIRTRLLRVVLVHGETDVVRDVMLYWQRQRSQGAFVWPPTCYRGGEDEGKWGEERLAFVRHVMGDGAAEQLGSLFMPGRRATVRDL